MHYELRRYTIQTGRLDDFVSAWTKGVIPLREMYGFTIHGAWTVEESSEFVWVLSHTNKGSFETANRRYYESDTRRSLDPDPAQFIAEVSEMSAQPVL